MDLLIKRNTTLGGKFVKADSVQRGVDNALAKTMISEGFAIEHKGDDPEKVVSTTKRHAAKVNKQAEEKPTEGDDS